MCACTADLFLGLLAILFPPLAVWVKTGICSADSIINICLCMLGYIPGLLHAWYIIAKFPEPEYEYTRIQDQERGRVTYVYVQGPNGNHQRVPKQQAGKGGYGTTAPMAPPVTQGQDGTWGNGTGSGSGNASAAHVPAPVSPVPTPGPGPVVNVFANEDAGEGSSQGVPPSYAEAVKGDHKIQTKD